MNELVWFGLVLFGLGKRIYTNNEKKEIISLPTTLYTEMNTRVKSIKAVFQVQISGLTAEIPRNMKMIVSAPLANIFMVYLTVVEDCSDILALTYFWQQMPQKVILGKKKNSIVQKIFDVTFNISLWHSDNLTINS